MVRSEVVDVHLMTAVTETTTLILLHTETLKTSKYARNILKTIPLFSQSIYNYFPTFFVFISEYIRL